jgi:CBS domain-containing protein
MGFSMRTARQLIARKGGQVFSIDAEAPVLQALQEMADRHVGALLVLRDGLPIGLVSERDYARKVILLGRSSAETAVWEIMASPVITTSPDSSVHACMALMTERRIRHLPVVEDGSLLGVLSIGDLVKAVIEDQQLEIDQLQHYIAG